MHACIHTYIYIYIRTHHYIHTYVHTYICAYVHTRTCCPKTAHRPRLAVSTCTIWTRRPGALETVVATPQQETNTDQCQRFSPLPQNRLFELQLGFYVGASGLGASGNRLMLGFCVKIFWRRFKVCPPWSRVIQSLGLSKFPDVILNWRTSRCPGV